jgi:HEAT repeat protein
MTDSLLKVLAQLGDESVPIRSVGLSHLSDLPRSEADRFGAAWAGVSTARRLELMAAMVEQSEANIHLNFHVVLRGCLSDGDERVRKMAVEGLWEDERPSLVGLLIALLQTDLASEVRAAAATSLGRFVLKGVLDEISESLAKQVEQALRSAWFRPHESVDVRRRALESLAYGDNAATYDLIDSAYYDDDELMRQSAVFAMGRTADRHWARMVMDELASSEAPMRYEAAASAGELRLKAAVRPLIRLLDDADGNVREAAVTALGKIGGGLARRALEFVVQSDDEPLAEAAEEALQELMFNVDLEDDARAAQGLDTDEGDQWPLRATARGIDAHDEPRFGPTLDVDEMESGIDGEFDGDYADDDADWDDDDDAEGEADLYLFGNDEEGDGELDWDLDEDPNEDG